MAVATAARRRHNKPEVINGSLAYDFRSLERQLEDTGRMDPDLYTAPLQETAADVISRARAHTKARVRVGQRLSPVIALGYTALAALMVLLVMSYVELAAISSNVVSMQEELSELQEDQRALQVKYEQAFDLTSVKESAEAAGMSQPSESQIYYIDLSDPDNAVVYQDQESGLMAFWSGWASASMQRWNISADTALYCIESG